MIAIPKPNKSPSLIMTMIMIVCLPICAWAADNADGLDGKFYVLEKKYPQAKIKEGVFTLIKNTCDLECVKSGQQDIQIIISTLPAFGKEKCNDGFLDITSQIAANKKTIACKVTSANKLFIYSKYQMDASNIGYMMVYPKSEKIWEDNKKYITYIINSLNLK